MQLVKRFVKITFLMDELSGKENELHSLHDVMHSEVEISSMRVCFVVLEEENDANAHWDSTNLDLEMLDSLYLQWYIIQLCTGKGDG